MESEVGNLMNTVRINHNVPTEITNRQSNNMMIPLLDDDITVILFPATMGRHPSLFGFIGDIH